jgi:predicted metalloprotease with PDZ domain
MRAVFYRLGFSALILLFLTPVARAQAPTAGAAAGTAPVDYKLSFADAAHHVMQVEATFPNVTANPLQVRMSRSSPGRYAAHDFAKNVFDVRITDGKGKALTAARPNPHQWDVGGHDGTVKITYKLYGNHVDGTYLAVDMSHAHMNIPATLMWARGLDMRPARLTFSQLPSASWKVATQLYPTSDPLSFTAPNLQYLMDSPTEISDFALRSFTVPSTNGGTNGEMSTIRVTVHHTGTDGEVDAFTKDIEKIVREATGVYGELPKFEPGYYTFLSDYLPWGGGDGMEHRNSTVCASRASLAANRIGLLGTISHEFFHTWNVERIRPQSLEPFNFEDANISGELWLAEGFTNYYGRLLIMRAGLRDEEEGVPGWAGVINGVTLSPGTAFRSAVEMSRLAPFVDAAVSIDTTYWPNTFYSYYTFGEAIALGLDLTLRERSGGKITLDDFMRAMWKTHGKPGGPAPGLVGKPYTIADAKARLAEASGDKAFADDFFARFIEGTQKMDYAKLLSHAGFIVRPVGGDKATIGALQYDRNQNRPKLGGPVIVGSPLYAAGLDVGDELVAIDDAPVNGAADVDKVVQSHKPGDEITIKYSRYGKEQTTKARLIADPRVEVVPVESTTGGTLTDAQKKFRESWLSSKAAGTR